MYIMNENISIQKLQIQDMYYLSFKLLAVVTHDARSPQMMFKFNQI